jgi:hypothetical protein
LLLSIGRCISLAGTQNIDRILWLPGTINGIQCLWRLAERIVLGSPVNTTDGKLAFSPEDQAKIADAEARTAAIMEQRLDAKDGPTETITAHSASEVGAFVTKYNGERNLYYSVNPSRSNKISARAWASGPELFEKFNSKSFSGIRPLRCAVTCASVFLMVYSTITTLIMLLGPRRSRVGGLFV